ncbi:hypothetical protein F4604DRAFT_1957381 [Suillus subluteus]|nr:hypothetical protein F4604DRAFT_1957381 [Suillus subluteus]
MRSTMGIGSKGLQKRTSVDFLVVMVGIFSLKRFVLPNDARDSLTSKYDATEAVQLGDRSDVSDHDASPSNDQSRAAELQANFGSVVVTDVDGNASANKLRAAAVRHIKNKGGGYIQVPHDLPVTLAIDSLYGSKKRP